MPNQMLWITDVEAALAIYELAKKRGKKPGDSIQDIFDEYKKEHPEKFKLVGTTDKDIDVITGDMRENGKKVVNLHEIDRQNKLKEEHE